MTIQGSSKRKAEHVAPPIDGDFYRIADLLDPKERVVAQRVREFMEAEVAPIIEDYWARDKFPFEIIPKIAGVGIGGIGYEGYGVAGGSMLLNGFVSMELARVDSSIATFWGVHTELSAGSIYLCGDEEQKQRWLPAMMRFEKIGSFGLTEPLVGSATSGGMMTTCRREGDAWVLNGERNGSATRPSPTSTSFGRATRPRARSRASWSARTTQASRSRRSRARWRSAWSRTAGSR